MLKYFWGIFWIDKENCIGECVVGYLRMIIENYLFKVKESIYFVVWLFIDFLILFCSDSKSNLKLINSCKVVFCCYWSFIF